MTPLPAFPVQQAFTMPVATQSPTLIDHALEQALYMGSTIFEWLGLTDAAANMRHYLDSSGQLLIIDAQRMLDAMPAFRAEVEAEAKRFARRIAQSAAAEYRGLPIRQNFSAQFGSSRWKSFYATRECSHNWYFAIGGFSYTFTALVVVPKALPVGASVAHVVLQLHVYDRYDWDSGRGTTIAGVHVANELIGQLQRVGLASEYDVVGHARPVLIDVPFRSVNGKWVAR
jgi:hypothetical protein